MKSLIKTNHINTGIFIHLLNSYLIFKSSHCRCSIKKIVLKNFAIFTGKQLWWCNIKKRLQHMIFFCEYCKTNASKVVNCCFQIIFCFSWGTTAPHNCSTSNCNITLYTCIIACVFPLCKTSWSTIKAIDTNKLCLSDIAQGCESVYYPDESG